MMRTECKTLEMCSSISNLAKMPILKTLQNEEYLEKLNNVTRNTGRENNELFMCTVELKEML